MTPSSALQPETRIVALAVFALVSVLGGLVSSPGLLVAARFVQTSFQVGGAVVLAIVTAVVDAGGAGRLSSAPAVLAAYRPALGLITGVAAIGMLVALSGLRRGRDRAAVPAGELVPEAVVAVERPAAEHQTPADLRR